MIRAQIMCRFSPLASKLLSLFSPSTTLATTSRHMHHSSIPARLPTIYRPTIALDPTPTTKQFTLPLCSNAAPPEPQRYPVEDTYVTRPPDAGFHMIQVTFNRTVLPSLLCDVWEGFGACRRWVKGQLEEKKKKEVTSLPMIQQRVVAGSCRQGDR